MSRDDTACCCCIRALLLREWPVEAADAAATATADADIGSCPCDPRAVNIMLFFRDCQNSEFSCIASKRIMLTGRDWWPNTIDERDICALLAKGMLAVRMRDRASSDTKTSCAWLKLQSNNAVLMASGGCGCYERGWHESIALG